MGDYQGPIFSIWFLVILILLVVSLTFYLKTFNYSRHPITDSDLIVYEESKEDRILTAMEEIVVKIDENEDARQDDSLILKSKMDELNATLQSRIDELDETVTELEGEIETLRGENKTTERINLANGIVFLIISLLIGAVVPLYLKANPNSKEKRVIQSIRKYRLLIAGAFLLYGLILIFLFFM